MESICPPLQWLQTDQKQNQILVVVLSDNSLLFWLTALTKFHCVDVCIS